MKTNVNTARKNVTNFSPATTTPEEDISQMYEKAEFVNELQFYGSNGLLSLQLTNFLNKYDTYARDIRIRSQVTPDHVFDIIKEKIDVNSMRFNFLDEVFFVIDNTNFVIVNYDLFNRNEEDQGGYYNINIYSLHRENAIEIKEHLYNNLKKAQINSVNWAFMTRSGNVIHKEMKLSEKNTDAHDSFYPWIKEGLNSYFKRFINSDENVLLLVGIPGTGKTTFIKNMLARHELNAIITYDEKLMGDDQFFLDFILGDKDMLIIEDADEMIKSREKSDNTVLSKILNVSDGLIKGINKKIIFSTNITDKGKIDSALMRPGRCFDVIDFREFTHDETLKVLKVTGIEKEVKSNHSYTLAELLSNSNDRETAKEEKIGFGFR